MSKGLAPKYANVYDGAMTDFDYFYVGPADEALELIARASPDDMRKALDRIATRTLKGAAYVVAALGGVPTDA